MVREKRVQYTTVINHAHGVFFPRVWSEMVGPARHIRISWMGKLIEGLCKFVHAKHSTFFFNARLASVLTKNNHVFRLLVVYD